MTLPVCESGSCVGVVQWLKVKLYDGVTYENMPGKIASHWPTPIYTFDRAIEISKGHSLKLKATLYEDGFWIDQLK